MRIYTSYYRKIDKVGSEFALIQVSNSKPVWFVWNVSKLPEVYPDWSNVQAFKYGVMTEDEFEKAYRDKLAQLDRNTILSKIETIANKDGFERDVVLLCWEGTGKFCHRHILAEWLGNNTEEWDE